MMLNLAFYSDGTVIRLSKMAMSDDITEHQPIIKYFVERGMTIGQSIEEMSSKRSTVP